MRFGLLSDEYIKESNPAFFPAGAKHKHRKYKVKNSVLPYYDLFAVAQVTLQNPYELINVYEGQNVAVVPPPIIPQAPQTPFTPAPYVQGSPNVGDVSASPMRISLEGDFDGAIDEYGSMMPSQGDTEPTLEQTRRTTNALKKLQINMVGNTVGGAPNVFTQDTSMLRANRRREFLTRDDVSESREELLATSDRENLVERPPSVRGENPRPATDWLPALYNLLE